MSSLKVRDPLSPSEVARIRRERARPRIWDHHYLHLNGLRREIAAALLETRGVAGPALDLYCGTQPYRSLLGERRTWGIDIDLHYASADVIGDQPLPFADESFAVVLCSQALYYRDDDHAVVAELRRTLLGDGLAVVTVPVLFTKSRNGRQRRYSSQELLSRFSAWTSVELRVAGSVGTGLAYAVGRLLQAAERRARWAKYLTRAAGVCVNALGYLVDWIAKPWTTRLPATLIVVARR
ncbi:MAG: methyltransferase domain-containing protein [Acidimicrobiia bacterium]|nr:methyltransferase domain-containing protein [Acidimicrobiia bacterium]NNL69131.1 methyltransferase domain-containing protein [Acidimicrobiia bacterium]